LARQIKNKKEASMQPLKRTDGKYEEWLNDIWFAEYFEDPATGLWRVDVFQNNVPEWTSTDFETIEEAQQAAQYYYAQH
jgi:hypothetical protein